MIFELTSQEDMEKLQKLCEEIIVLNDKKMELLKYLESRMSLVAPNVCEIIGPKVAS